MSIKKDNFPSSVAFEEIQRVLGSDEGVRKDSIKNAGSIFGFTLKNKKGEVQSWHIDLKEAGAVGLGDAPQGKKADVVLSLSDDDFMKLVKGDAKAQQLFMGGKLKIKGNIMKATKLEPILSKSRSKSKL